MLLHRLYTLPPLPEALRPTLGIQLAPPAVGALAYLGMTAGLPDLPAHALLGYALFQALLLTRLLPWITRQPFAPSYWAFSFGVTALSTALLRMAERGDFGVARILAAPAFIAANIVLCILVAGTARLAWQRRLLPRPA